jgi:hypothetical protein
MPIGLSRVRGTINIRPIANSASPALAGVRYGEHYGDHLAAAVGYLLKSADPTTAAANRLQRARDDGGTLTGRRSATSTNIEPAARRTLFKTIKSALFV